MLPCKVCLKWNISLIPYMTSIKIIYIYSKDKNSQILSSYQLFFNFNYVCCHIFGADIKFLGIGNFKKKK